MAAPPLFEAPFLQHLPLDILYPILAQLTDRKDLHTCTLVSKAFCRVVTPFLYKTLDSRIISKTFVHHPSTTLLRRPELALYVRHVTETGAIHSGMLARNPKITENTLAALSLCINLRSMTWIDDININSSSDATLLAFLDVLKTLPVRELTIRTHSDLSETVWTQLVSLKGLRKVSIWCMEGPPRALQGSQWSGPLGSTLTHLELGVSAFLYPCSELLAQLPLLTDLRLKGAPASSIPTILTYLPNLQSLDTEYLLSGSGFHQSKYIRLQQHSQHHSHSHNAHDHSQDDSVSQSPLAMLGGGFGIHHHVDLNSNANHIHNQTTSHAIRTGHGSNLNITGTGDYVATGTSDSNSSLWSGSTNNQDGYTRSPSPNHPEDSREHDGEEEREHVPIQHPPPTLRHLTIRTSSFGSNPDKLWSWVRDLTPRPGLETFKLHAFVYGYASYTPLSGNPAVPRQFIEDLAISHRDSLRHFDVGEVYMSLEDLKVLCETFPKLELLICAIAAVDVASITRSISGAKNLQSLKLQVQWIPDSGEEEAGKNENINDDTSSTAHEAPVDENLHSRSFSFSKITDAEITKATGNVHRDSYFVYHGYAGRQEVQVQVQERQASPTWSTPPYSSTSRYPLSPSSSSSLPSPSSLLSSPFRSPPHSSAHSSVLHPPSNIISHSPSKSTMESRKTSDLISYYSKPDPHRSKRHYYIYSRFTLEDAMEMMLRNENSKLRSISIGGILYTGKWDLQGPEECHSHNKSRNGDEPWNGYKREKDKCTYGRIVDEKLRLKFVVSAEIAGDNWRT